MDETRVERPDLSDPRAEVQRLARKSRPGEVARQVEGTRKLIAESRKLRNATRVVLFPSARIVPCR